MSPAGAIDRLSAAAVDPAFFDRPAPDVARHLIGCRLEYMGAGGVIVETEAYDERDPASHSFRGRRGRAAAMYGPPGSVYVYRSYGIHWCLNLVCEPEGVGSAVLVRALRPTTGLEQMRSRRQGPPDKVLCAGPGRLTSALGIDGRLDGDPGVGPAGSLTLMPPTSRPAVGRDTRIGISRGLDRFWRFGLLDSAHVSRPFPHAGVPH